MAEAGARRWCGTFETVAALLAAARKQAQVALADLAAAVERERARGDDLPQKAVGLSYCIAAIIFAVGCDRNGPAIFGPSLHCEPARASRL